MINPNLEDAIELIDFKTLEDFKENSNNFPAHFNPPLPNEERTIIGDFYQRRECFKRFKNLYLDLEKKLTESVLECRAKGKLKIGGEGFPDEIWKRLREAYTLMSKLVSKYDTGAIKNGQPDKYYLIR